MLANGYHSFSSFSILIIFLMLGLISFCLIGKLSIQLLPTQATSSVTITTSLHNASSKTIELEITAPIESALARLQGITELNSISSKGTSTVIALLDPQINPDIFRLEASNMMAQIHHKLPKEATFPNVVLNKNLQHARGPYNTNLLFYTLTGPGTPYSLGKFTENQILPLLTEVSGIKEIKITKANPIRLSILPNRSALNALKISNTELQSLLSLAFHQQEIGMYDFNSENLIVSLDQAIHSEKELLEFPIKSIQGRQFFLKDLATIKLEEKPEHAYFRINGKNVTNIIINADTDVNIIKTGSKIKEILSDFQKETDSDYQLALHYDHSASLQDELKKIYLRTVLSVLMVSILILLITRKTRYFWIVILSLAINILLTGLIYYLFKIKIHLYAIAGITISLGFIMDHVIVTVEDIERTGHNRIFKAILASTVTALGVLILVYFLDDSEKENLVDFFLAMMINLVTSIPVFYFFIPALLKKIPINLPFKTRRTSKTHIFIKIKKFYNRQLIFITRFKSGLIFFYFLSLMISIFIFFNKTPSNLNDSFFKKDPKKTQLQIIISMPFGTTIYQINSLTLEFEKYLAQYTDQLDCFTTQIPNSTTAYMDITFKHEEDQLFPHILKQALEKRSKHSGSAEFTILGIGKNFNNAMDLFNVNSTFQLKGYQYEQLRNLALQIRDSLLKQPRVQHVHITTTPFWENNLYEEFMLRFEQQNYLTTYNLRQKELYFALINLQEKSIRLGEINKNDMYIPVEIVNNSLDIPSLWSVMNQPFLIGHHTKVKIEKMMHLEKVKIGEQIFRQNQQYHFYVHYQFLGTQSLNQLVSKHLINQTTPFLPYGYSISTDDPVQNWQWTKKNNYIGHILLILFIIFIIGAILLESLSQPMTIIMMIPISFIGVLYVFQILDLQLNQGGYAALLLLGGLVPNSALYIFHDLNYFLKGNRWQKIPSRNQRILFIKTINAKSAPILVTTTSTILSLLPFLIHGDENEFWFTLSAGTISGLLFSLIGVYMLLPIFLLSKKR